jgi:hypothetical protein
MDLETALTQDSHFFISSEDMKCAHALTSMAG